MYRLSSLTAPVTDIATHCSADRLQRCTHSFETRACNPIGLVRALSQLISCPPGVSGGQDENGESLLCACARRVTTSAQRYIVLLFDPATSSLGQSYSRLRVHKIRPANNESSDNSISIRATAWGQCWIL